MKMGTPQSDALYGAGGSRHAAVLTRFGFWTPPRCSAAAFRLGRRMTGRSTGQLEPCIKSSVSLPPDLSAQVVITCCAATPRSSASDFLLYRLCVWANFGSWELLECGKITAAPTRRPIARPSPLAPYP